MATEKFTSFDLVQPKPSPKMDAIFSAMEIGFPNAKRNCNRGHKVIWGLIGKNAEISQKMDYSFVDMPYYGRLVDEDYKSSYWRWAYRSLHDTRKLNVPGDRFESWNVEIKPWQTGGDFILLCPSSDTMTRYFYGVNQKKWLQDTYNEIRKYTNMPIRVRYKPRKNGRSGPQVETVSMQEDLAGCHALVTSASLTAIDALLEGVPVFSNCKQCPSAWVTNPDIGNINNIVYNDREILFHNLAYKQFSITEFRNSIAHKIIERYINV
jgi:hypothetical protein